MMLVVDALAFEDQGAGSHVYDVDSIEIRSSKYEEVQVAVADEEEMADCGSEQ